MTVQEPQEHVTHTEPKLTVQHQVVHGIQQAVAEPQEIVAIMKIIKSTRGSTDGISQTFTAQETIYADEG